MIGAYNIVLHDAVIAALNKERELQMEQLAMNAQTDLGGYRYRVGCIKGLADAVLIAEEIRVKMMET